MNECDFLIVIYKAIPARMECILLNKEMINCRFFFEKGELNYTIYLVLLAFVYLTLW